MTTKKTYIDEQPAMFKRDKAIELIQQAQPYLNKYVRYDGHLCKFASMDAISTIMQVDKSTYCCVMGRLLSDTDYYHADLSIDKIIDLFKP